jgi:CBS domain-containing protein
MDIDDLTAADVMTHAVYSVAESMDLRETMTALGERGISGAPVLDDNGRLVGVISQTDIVIYYLGREDELAVEGDFYQRAHLRGETVRGFQVLDTNVSRVKDVMSQVTVTAPSDTCLRELAQIMVRREIHRVIIVDEGEIVGVVSALDLLRPLAR